MRRASVFFRRALLGIVLASSFSLFAGQADAAVPAVAQAPGGQLTGVRPGQRPMTLSQRRAQVQRDLHPVAGAPRHTARMISSRRLTRQQVDARLRARAALQRSRASGRTPEPAPASGARKAAASAPADSTWDILPTSDFVVAAASGPVEWDYLNNFPTYPGIPAEPPLPGYPNLPIYSNSNSAIYPGESLTITSAWYNDSTTTQNVDITLNVECGDSEDTYDLGNVASVSDYVSASVLPQGAILTTSFTAPTPSPGSATCDDTYTPVSMQGIMGVSFAEVADGNDNWQTATLWSNLISIPGAELIGCPIAGNSAAVALAQGLCGDPIDTASGSYSDSFTDAGLASPGYPLAVGRDYSSAVTAAGPLGPGWTMPWLASLSIQPNGDAIFNAENGSQYHYASNGDGTFAPPPGATSVLALNSAGDYTLTTLRHDQLVFNGSGQLIAENDATGRGLTLSYTSGELAQITDAAGQSVSLSYSGGLLTGVALPNGHSVDYGYTGGQLTSVTGPDGQTTSYRYNSAGLLASIVDPDGNDTVRNTYNSNGQVTSQEDAAGNTMAFSYTTTSDGLQETDVTDPGQGVTTDVYGGNMLLASYDPLGNETTYTYNQFQQPVSVTDPAGHVTMMTYDTNGNLLTETNALSAEQQWTYDSSNNLLTYTDADNNTTTYTYNSTNEVTSQAFPAGGTATYSYDGNGNLVSSVDPRGNVPGASAAPYTTTYTYNSAGQLASRTDPDGNQTSYSYDAMGFPLTVTDPGQRVTSYTYDADERPLTVTAAGSVTKYAYDPAGNLVTETDPDGNAYTYGYDSDNRLAKVTDPLGNAQTYGYDGDGNQTTQTDARNITTTTAYDADARPIAVTYSDGAPGISYAYDASGNLAKITDGTGARTLAYDAANELTSAAGPGSGSFSYGYDPAGNLLSRSYPDGTQLSYTYTADGQIASVSSGAAVTDYAYDAADDLTSATEPNNVTESRTYDGAGQLTGIRDATGTATLDSYSLTLTAAGQPSQVAVTQAGTVQPTRYDSYDSAGRLTAACSSFTGSSGCSGSNQTTYGYDQAGNLISTATGGVSTTNTYNADEELTKAVTGSTTLTYGYNADGDQTSAGSQTYAYNGVGELAKAVTSAGTYTYGYDAGGDLTTTSLNGTKVEGTVWDLNNTVPMAAADTNGTGATTADYVYGPAGELASMTAGGTSYQAVTDWLSSVTGLTNSSGNQVSSTTYGAYGASSTKNLVGTPPASSIGFAGSYRQAGGLDDMRARDYNPATASFTSVDPMLSATGQPYVYAGDDPVANTDPDGTITCPAWLPGCGVVTNAQNAVSGAAHRWLQQWQSGWSGRTLCSVQSFGIFVTTPRNVTYKIPDGWLPRVSNNGRGIIFQEPGATGNANSIRIMEPTSDYPNGYVRIYNSKGQPLDSEGGAGNPAGRDATHIPEDETGPFPELPIE